MADRNARSPAALRHGIRDDSRASPACPTRPYKAIYVDGNPVHKLAKKPVVKKVEVNVDTNEDFPF